MARYNKKRARQLKHDRFRDTTLSAFERLGDRLAGKGPVILYSIAGLIALAVAFGLWSWWSGRRANEARTALGQAIEITQAPASGSQLPGANALSFPNEQERAKKAVEAFEKVAAEYNDPYRTKARYFAAVNLLVIDRPRGVSELEALSKSGDGETSAWARFALAQARKADGQLDAAATLYGELARAKDPHVPPDTASFYLAAIYEKQGKKKEAADILFQIVEAARKALDENGKPAPQPASARAAAGKLETLDPARFAQLPPEPLAANLQS